MYYLHVQTCKHASPPSPAPLLHLHCHSVPVFAVHCPVSLRITLDVAVYPFTLQTMTDVEIVLAKSSPQQSSSYGSLAVPAAIIPLSVQGATSDGAWFSGSIALEGDIQPLLICSIVGSTEACHVTKLNVTGYVAFDGYDSRDEASRLALSWLKLSAGDADGPQVTLGGQFRAASAHSPLFLPESLVSKLGAAAFSSTLTLPYGVAITGLPSQQRVSALFEFMLGVTEIRGAGDVTARSLSEGTAVTMSGTATFSKPMFGLSSLGQPELSVVGVRYEDRDHPTKSYSIGFLQAAIDARDGRSIDLNALASAM